MSNQNPVIHAPKIPPGIIMTIGEQRSLSVHLGDPETRNFIKACMHVITMMEGTNPACEPPELTEVHPGIKAFLDDIGKKP